MVTIFCWILIFWILFERWSRNSSSSNIRIQHRILILVFILEFNKFDQWEYIHIQHTLYKYSDYPVCDGEYRTLAKTYQVYRAPPTPFSVAMTGESCSTEIWEGCTARKTTELLHRDGNRRQPWPPLFFVCVVLGFDPIQGTPLVVWEGGPNIWLFWRSERMPNNQRWF